MATDTDIDDSLYSRQRYVLGDSAMKRMAQSNVLLVGAGGVGIEIAKNLALAGVKSLTIQDWRTSSMRDLGCQFFLRTEDVLSGRNRAEASVARLTELNPYVTIQTLSTELTAAADLSYLKQFQCVVLTECPLDLQIVINKFCRSQSPPISFIVADVYGVFAVGFCDFGDKFEVLDVDGEDPKEIFISNISNSIPAVVTCMDGKRHGLQSGDTVTFKEVNGPSEINGQQFSILEVTPDSFKINLPPGLPPYENGGIVTQVKLPSIVAFASLEQQLKSPNMMTPDFSKMQAPSTLHAGFLALHRFQTASGQLPQPWCASDAAQLVTLAKETAQSLEPQVEMDAGLVEKLAFTSKGQLAPLCATLGGVMAQEALKSLTGKFSPLNQWLYLDSTEVLPDSASIADTAQFQPRSDRYDDLRQCVGEEMCKTLANLTLFMVGCGAIGCEMLKNYALLGVSTGPEGKISITDNDLIEKSNLNRQFLFRSHHIRKPKSTTAAAAVLEINPDMKIDAHQHRVCPQTEKSVYTDSFFLKQQVVVNALDNVEARRYMDSRCVTNKRPLLESGTMGAKGHVQVIVPHLTESYSNQQDPADEEYPYCTVKSFPAVMEHCIQWSRDKFEQMFMQKPNLFNKFMQVHSNLEEVADVLQAGQMVDGAIKVSKLAESRPLTLKDCVVSARHKFEKYFNHKAKQLLHAFPLDTKLADGSPFWQSPKRPPTPIEFDINNSMHCLFVASTTKLQADICGVPWTPEALKPDVLRSMLEEVTIPEFHPSQKRIITDESLKAGDVEEPEVGEDEFQESRRRLLAATQSPSRDAMLKPLHPVDFEKDDDSNGHIDFITAASNLRAVMYGIEPADRLKIKRIAGRIVPAIATTTAAVSGLVSVELLKVCREGLPLELFKNAFLNLALPLLLLTEPGAVESTQVAQGLSFTLWDRWTVRGHADFTLQNFIDALQAQQGLTPNCIVQGVKMVYMPIMKPHRKRLPQPMVKLLKPDPGQEYVDLVVSYQGSGDSVEDVEGPPVRYYFSTQ